MHLERYDRLLWLLKSGNGKAPAWWVKDVPHKAITPNVDKVGEQRRSVYARPFSMTAFVEGTHIFETQDLTVRQAIFHPTAWDDLRQNMAGVSPWIDLNTRATDLVQPVATVLGATVYLNNGLSTGEVILHASDRSGRHIHSHQLLPR